MTNADLRRARMEFEANQIQQVDPHPRPATAVKLYKTEDGYQSDPKCQSGIGRFQVRRTDNSSARACGRLPKWTVRDLYENVMAPMGVSFDRFDTLVEVREWIASKLFRGSRDV